MIQKEFDIVIIGSGAGGGVVAKELSSLCRTGARMALLEWGPKFKEEEFTGRETEMAGKLYFDGGGFLTRDRTMTLAYGCAYGGSTVVYTGTSLTIPESVIKKWNVPGLEYSDIIRRSKKYLQENNVHLLEEDKINDNNHLFREACLKLGYRVEQFPINVKGCQGSGLCNLGCPNQAKQGTLRVQLPIAEQNGVEVVTCCRVTKIGDRVCHAAVENRNFGLPSAWEDGEYEIRSKIIVVCCGAINSTALLLRSQLPVNLPALGRYFTCHPALILVGEHEQPITNYFGHPKSYYCDEFVESKKFLLETCMYFPFTTAKNLIGFGQNHRDMLFKMDHLQMILVLAIDRALPENRITVDGNGNPVVSYRLGKEVLEPLYQSMKVCAKIFFAAGAKRVHAPAGEKFFIEREQQPRLDELISRRNMKPGRISVASAHLMGGCRMGDNPQTSVTNEWGEVHGLPWLYVADSSLFPGASEINPYITIMALADRVAERIKKNVGATGRSPVQ